MRLVLATPLYPPEIGGPATYAKTLVEGLHGKGIDVRLVKFSDVRGFPKGIRHLVYERKLARALKDADAILALDPVSVGIPAMRTARRLKKPLFVKVVGDYAWEQGTQRFGVTQALDEFVHSPQHFIVRKFQKAQTRVAAAATRVIVPSEYLKGIVATWGVPKEKISVIYNAVPQEAAGAVPAEVERLPRPLVASVGRLVPWKGVDGVIEALGASHTGSIVVVGDGPLRASLEALAGQKLPGRAAFTGQLSHADTLATMQAADVLVLNSTYEGLPHLLIEAQQLGIPIIATRVGGTPEVVTDGETGLLVGAGNTHMLADALARVCADHALRARLSSRAKDSVSRFSVESMLGQTVALLSHVGHTMSHMEDTEV